MVSNGIKINVIIISLILTVLIFIIGNLLDYGIDKIKLYKIQTGFEKNTLEMNAYALESDFIDSTNSGKCYYLNQRIFLIKEDLKKIVLDMATYTGKSYFNKDDFDIIKRKYILLQFNFYSLLLKANNECDNSYYPVLFFFKKDEESSISQGYILDEFSELHNESVVIFSLDQEFQKEPILTLLMKKYNITSSPALVLGDNKAYLKLQSLDFLEQKLYDFFLNESNNINYSSLNN